MAALHTNDLSFVKAPPEEIQIECPICLGIMFDDPHLVSCCGHHFCGPCIKTVKHSNQPCPICKEKEFQAVPDKGRFRIINGLQVNCTNKGCGWKGELKSLPSHIHREKREGECQFEVVKCKYDECEVKQQRQHLRIHEEEKCDQRPYDCQYCRHKGTYQYITQKHYLQCTQYPLPCPEKCDGKFPRGDIKSHLSTVCPLQPVECDFKWAGCHYTPPRRDLPQHNIENHVNHMSLLAKFCGELKQDNGELKVMCQGLEKENEELKVVCQELKRDNSDMKQQLVNVHHAMVDDHHSLLPVTVSHNDICKGVRYFYSKPCGHLMSVEVDSSCNIIIKVYKGRFHNSQLPLVSEIVIKFKDKNGTTTIKTITRGNCWNYKDTFDRRTSIIQKFTLLFNIKFINEFDIVNIQ